MRAEVAWELDDETVALTKSYAEARDAVEQWTARKEEIRQQLIDKLQEHNADGGNIGDKLVVTARWTRPPLRFNTQRFKRDYPDFYSQYEVEGQPSLRVEVEL